MDRVTGDYTIKPEDIEEKIRNLDRRKHEDAIAKSSNDALAAVSAVGTETPITVLMDIRQILSDISSEMRTNREQQEELLELSRKQHRETLAYMQAICDETRKLQTVPSHVSHERGLYDGMSSGLSSANSETKYYYRGDEIKTIEAVVGCILLHLDLLISKAIPPDPTALDTTIMELNDWAGLVRILKLADSNVTSTDGPLKLPSFRSSEVRDVMNIIASPTKGRTVTCKPEHMLEIVSSYPNMAHIVNEVRLRILECPGFISAVRMKRLSSVSFPFVTSDFNMNITDPNPRVAGSRIVADRVKEMKHLHKVKYSNAILRDKMRPMNACTKALDV